MTTELLPFQQLEKLTQQHPDIIFLRQPVNDVWQELSYQDVLNQVRKIANSLLAMGLAVDDKVAIFSKNCSQWLIADWAIGLAGGISVPLYPAADNDSIEYVMQHSGAKIVFVGKLDNAEQYQDCFADGITKIGLPYDTIRVDKTWADMLTMQPDETSMPTRNLDDVMTIIYTSGSTGQPKGVVLTYKSYISGCYNYADNIHHAVPLSSERYLSYLPLAHITERVLGQGLSLYIDKVNARLQISFVESLATFADNLRDVAPTIFVSVPRLWQKFQSGVLAKVPQTKLSLLLHIPFIKDLIKNKIKKGLGFQHTRIFASGSAPIAPSLLSWYETLDINIAQGWGMSETNAAGTTQLPYRSDKRNTIGKALDGATIRIGDDNEIQIKGDFLLKEYYLEPEKTKAAFTDDGYFKTGDQGKMDDEGYIQIIGRIKDIFKTSKGKYVVPAPIEAVLAKCTLLEQICVVGNNLKQPVVLAVLSESAENIPKEKISRTLEALLDEVNQDLDKHEKLDGMWILNTPWTPENELMTPTLKIRRQHIEKHLQAIYEQPLNQRISWQ
ncbi:AMP-binding protein [Alteromonadaceae bacterium BrNp21-10]|nr:AMP-binding protein [Alteromonadaceae bacterium BrNp21-10]